MGVELIASADFPRLESDPMTSISITFGNRLTVEQSRTLRAWRRRRNTPGNKAVACRTVVLLHRDKSNAALLLPTYKLKDCSEGDA